MAAKRQQKDIKCITLLTVKRKEATERGNALELRVVDWVIDGKHYKKLENRELFYDQNSGEEKTGKAKGMSLDDMNMIMDKWGEIMTALGSKLPEHNRNGAPAATESESTAAAASAGAEQEF